MLPCCDCDQTTTADGFIIDAVGAAHRRRCAARHFLRGRRHLVHRRRHLLDLASAARPQPDCFAQRRFPLVRPATFYLTHGMPDAFDQVVDLGFTVPLNTSPNSPEFIAAMGHEVNGHVAGRDLVHHRPQATQGGAGRRIETGI